MNTRDRAMTGAQPPYDACPECGCTDIEIAAWVHANTDEIISCGCDGPCEDWVWCPQCEQTDQRTQQVTALKPYDPDVIAEGPPPYDAATATGMYDHD